MGDRTRSQEYDTLREELLPLGERAHDVWRWGLVSMLAVFGALAVALMGEQPGPNGTSGRLTQFLTVHGPWVVVAVNLFFGAMAERMSTLRTHVLEEMHRIGAYVAVFHDEAPGRVPDTATQLGWHVWNRVDKFLQEEPRVDSAQLIQRQFHGTSWVYLLVLVLVVVSTTILIDAVANLNTWLCGPVGAAICIGVAIRLRSLEKGDRRDASRWNRRWGKLARLDGKQLNALIEQTGLRP